MAYEITLEGDGEGVLITLLGSVEPEEHIEAISAANEVGEAHGARYCILDRRSAASSVATVEDARRVVLLTAEGPLGKGGRLASVGPSVYPRAEQAFRHIIGGWIPDGLEMANFDDIDEARDWAAKTA